MIGNKNSGGGEENEEESDEARMREKDIPEK